VGVHRGRNNVTRVHSGSEWMPVRRASRRYRAGDRRSSIKISCRPASTRSPAAPLPGENRRAADGRRQCAAAVSAGDGRDRLPAASGECSSARMEAPNCPGVCLPAVCFAVKPRRPRARRRLRLAHGLRPRGLASRPLTLGKRVRHNNETCGRGLYANPRRPIARTGLSNRRAGLGGGANRLVFQDPGSLAGKDTWSASGHHRFLR